MSERSFRDPLGELFFLEQRVFRRVWDPQACQIEQLLESSCVQHFLKEGLFIASKRVTPEAAKELMGDSQAFLLEHPKVPFPSYSHEWLPEMLHKAATLTLGLCMRGLQEGIGLRDGTPANVLFIGPKPCFIDLLSLEYRDPKQRIWLAYSQFVKTFLLPLLLYKRAPKLAQQFGLLNYEKADLQDFLPLLGGSKWRSPALFLVTLPAFLSRLSKEQNYHSSLSSARTEEEATYTLKRLFSSLKRTLNKLAPPLIEHSSWSDYGKTPVSYAKESWQGKYELVGAILRAIQAHKVLDIGCNTGEFSLLAANSGASVVSIDTDLAALQRLWRCANEEGKDILPLVVDFAAPTPGLGWANEEKASFLERAKDHFDCVLMLAVIHHLLVSDRIPLTFVCQQVARITTDHLIIEYVPKEDPLFQRIARGREALHADFTQESFEKAFQERFSIVSKQEIPRSQRWLYHMRKKG